MSMQKLPEDYEAVLPKLYMLHANEGSKEMDSYLVLKRIIDIFSPLLAFSCCCRCSRWWLS